MAVVSPKHQITLPSEIRRKLNIRSGDELVFVEENGKFYITKLEDLRDEVLDSFDDLQTTEREFRKGFRLES